MVCLFVIGVISYLAFAAAHPDEAKQQSVYANGIQSQQASLQAESFCSRNLDYRLNVNLPTPTQHIEDYLDIAISTNKEEVSQFLNEIVFPDVTSATTRYAQLDLLLYYSLHPMLATYYCPDLAEVEESLARFFADAIQSMTVPFMSDYSSDVLESVLIFYSYFGQDNNFHLLGELDSFCPSTSSDTENFCRVVQLAEIFNKIEKFANSDGETEFIVLRANFAFLSLWDPTNSGQTIPIQGKVQEYTVAVVQALVYAVDTQSEDILGTLSSVFTTYLSVECTASSSMEECLMHSAATILSSFLSRSTEITEGGRTHKVIYTDKNYETFFQFNLLTTILRGTEYIHSTLLEVATYIQSQIECEINPLGSAIFMNLGNYFGALHTFDEAKAVHDVAYIQGRLEFYNFRATSYSSLVDQNLDTILVAAITMAAANLAYRTIQVGLAIAENMNPLGWLFGAGSVNEVSDAIEAAAEAAGLVADAGILLDRLRSEIKPMFEDMQNRLDKNARMLAVIVNVVNGLEAGSSTFDEDQKTFLQEYGGYSPIITSPDLARLGQELEFLAEDACGIIRDISSPPVSAQTFKSVLNVYCVDVFADIQDLIETYNEIYDFQFELVETLATVVRARTGQNAAINLQNSWTNTVTDCRSTDVLDRYAMLAGMSEAVYQLETWQAIEEYCTILEYENGGVQPSVCSGPSTRLESLLSFQPDKCDYTRDYFAFPAFISTGYDYDTFTRESITGKLNLTALLAGESVSFKIPDREWLMNAEIVDERDVDTAIYVLMFEVYLPVVSTFKTSVTVVAYPSATNQLVPGGTSYAMDAELVSEYSEGIHVNCIQTSLPNPYSLCPSNTPPDICMNTLAFTRPEEETLVHAPSIYAHWNITVYGYEDLTSVYQPADDMDVWVGMTLCKKRRGSGQVQARARSKATQQREGFARSMQTERCCDTSEFWSQESLSCEACPSGTAPELYGYYCNDTDECSETDGLCEHICNNIIGSYYCSCFEGFTLNDDGYSCDDIMECEEPTSCDQLCTNSIGSYECSCIDGYTINSDAYNCDDIDECSEMDDLCEHICNNINGSYYCSCYEGFTLNDDGYSCDDIIECEEPTSCDQLCTNSIGSYECSCIDGYTINSDAYHCDDLDECSVPGSHMCIDICVNNVGSYSCSCREGYTINDDGYTCDDVDECEQPTNCDHVCTNTVGSYQCSCNEGYAINSDAHTCDDVNECSEFEYTLCDHTCTNTVGSYLCGCVTGYELQDDGYTCEVTGQGITVYVGTLTGKRIVLSGVLPTDTIEHVKSLISDKEGISPAKQLLFYGRQLLNNAQTLDYYRITHESTLLLVVSAFGK